MTSTYFTGFISIIFDHFIFFLNLNFHLYLYDYISISILKFYFVTLFYSLYDWLNILSLIRSPLVTLSTSYNIVLSFFFIITKSENFGIGIVVGIAHTLRHIECIFLYRYTCTESPNLFLLIFILPSKINPDFKFLIVSNLVDVDPHP